MLNMVLYFTYVSNVYGRISQHETDNTPTNRSKCLIIDIKILIILRKIFNNIIFTPSAQFLGDSKESITQEGVQDLVLKA